MGCWRGGNEEYKGVNHATRNSIFGVPRCKSLCIERVPITLTDALGRLQVIQKLTDAILTDARIFRIEDALWLPMYNRQSKCGHT